MKIAISTFLTFSMTYSSSKMPIYPYTGLVPIQIWIGTNQKPVLYRSWMLTPEKYGELISMIEASGASMITSCGTYALCHHLPNWYESCLEYTAVSRFFADDCDLLSNVTSLKWDRYFVKDFVKSNSNDRSSIAYSPEEVLEIVELIRTYRGDIEGGVVVRQVENYVEGSERRYFVFNGMAYSADGDIPALVHAIACRITAPFFSVDIVQRDDGQLRLVEIGDGQVSDKKEWRTENFVSMILGNI